MSRQVYFVTGTDTDVGKTYVSCHLLRAAGIQGKRTLGLKPLAAGAEQTAQGLRNGDALLLQQAATIKLSYEQVNPFCFAPAIAPHIAAQQSGISLTAANLADSVMAVLNETSADYVLIEGAGGWCVPINDAETLADVAALLSFPVLLVVGMKLGCLNHALLTAEAICADGLGWAGWVANDLGDPMPHFAENIAALERRLPAPRMRVD